MAAVFLQLGHLEANAKGGRCCWEWHVCVPWMYLGLQLSALHVWLNALQLWQQSWFVCRGGSSAAAASCFSLHDCRDGYDFDYCLGFWAAFLQRGIRQWRAWACSGLQHWRLLSVTASAADRCCAPCCGAPCTTCHLLYRTVTATCHPLHFTVVHLWGLLHWLFPSDYTSCCAGAVGT